MLGIAFAIGTSCWLAVCPAGTSSEQELPETPLTEEQQRELIDQARALERRAGEQFAAQQLTDLRGTMEEMLAIAERLYPKSQFPDGHPTLAVILTRLGSVYNKLGLTEESLAASRRGSGMAEALLPEDDMTLAHIRNDLATTLADAGEAGEALTLALKAHETYRDQYPASRFPNGHRDMANNLAVLANCYRHLGDWARAQAASRRSTEMMAGLLPPGDIRLTDARHDFGLLLLGSGEYAKAEAVLLDTLAEYRRHYPEDTHPKGHPRLINNLSSLSMAAARRGDPERSLGLLNQFAEMSEAYYPKGALVLSDTLHDIAVRHGESSRYREAADALRRAIPGYRRHFPGGHGKLVNAFANLALSESELGEHEAALESIRRGLAMGRELFGDTGNDQLVRAASVEAHVLDAAGRTEEARRAARKAAEMCRRLAEQFAAQSSEAETLNFLASMPRSLDLYLGITARLGTPAGEVYLAVWAEKATVMRAIARRRERLPDAARDDPEVREAWDELAATRRRLARAVRADEGGPEYRERVNELSGRKEQLERELAAALPAVGPPLRSEPTPAGLCDALPGGSAFLDVRRYARSAGIDSEGTAHYAAFVLGPDTATRRVELGPAEPIDAAVRRWLEQIRGGREGSAGGDVRRLVWEPVAELLPAGTETLWVVPDGWLARLPWAAIPGERSGTVLLERYAFAVVPHGPFLAKSLEPAERANDLSRLLTVSGVDYAAAGGSGFASDSPAPDGPKVKWGELPGTELEAGRVLVLSGERESVHLGGADATTARLVAELPRCAYAHLATHGFFADERFRSVLRMDRGLFGTSAGGDRAAAGARNPLVLSGLVLAGANRPRPTDLEAILTHDDGILTAEAVAGLDLSGLELAVLSACETGLGEVAGGEGVYGLQRAFHVAGCDNVVASLWKVDDEATAALMAKFYHELWVNKKPPIEALRQAQLTVYRHPERIRTLARTRGFEFEEAVKLPAETPSRGDTTPASLWAAFVLSGVGSPAG